MNECMILYFEHTWHVIKTSHKSIKQDYKLWTLEDHDYIFNWLWHLKAQDTENLDSRSCYKFITDTQALIISLAKSLSDLLIINYILYLDNLFSNILLAKILEELDIDIMSMIQVNVLRFSLELVQLKQVKQSLKWEHLKTAEADEIDCFLW